MQADTEPTPPQAEALAALCQRAVGEALRLGDPDAFLAWMQDQVDSTELADLELEGDNLRRMLYWLGRSIWNGLPQPDHHFKPRPLPQVRRNDPCPCGSGRKFKKCCVQVQGQMPTGMDESLERAAAASLDVSQRQALAADRQAPLRFKLAVAGVLAEEEDEDFAGVPELLLPVFDSPPVRGSMDLLLPAVDLLMEALEQQAREPEAEALLRRLAAGDRGPLAGYAHARLGVVALLAGDAEGCLRRARLALEADHSDPRPATLEISALVALGQVEEARARAAHWHREALEHWPEETDFIERMEGLRVDPEAAHPDRFWELPEDLARLGGLVLAGCRRPLPAPRLEAEPALEGEAAGQGRPRLVVAPADEAVGAAEDAWIELRDAEPAVESLADWLEDYPAGLDSPVVLDGLAGAIEALHRPDSEAYADAFDRLVLPLLQRLRDLALAVLDRFPEGHVLPLDPPANASLWNALRDHARYLCDDDEHADPEAGLDLLRRLLALEPEGRHGVAGELANFLLCMDRPEEALAVTESRPQGASPALAYDRVLALFRLGRRDEAAQALADAAAAMPRVLDFLLTEHALPQEPDEAGSNLEAVALEHDCWIYALHMGEEFLATPGLEELLRNQRADPT